MHTGTSAPAAPRPAASATSKPGPPGDDVHDAPTAPLADAPKVAAGFAAAWVRRDLPAARWRAGITPWCEPRLARQMTTVEPSNVPASRVTGAPTAIQAPAGGVATYTVATDAGTLTVWLVNTGGRWRVSVNDWSGR